MIQGIVAVGLATFTLLLMLKDLDGPFDIFKWIRDTLCEYDASNIPINFFGKLFDCPWCLSTWIAAFVAIVYVLVMTLPVMYFFFLWLAAIAVADMIYVYLMA